MAKDYKFNLRLSAEDKLRMEYLAMTKGCSAADLVRKLVKKAYKRHMKKATIEVLTKEGT